MESVGSRSVAEEARSHRRRFSVSAAVAAFFIFHLSFSVFNSVSGAPIPWKLPKYTLVARDMDLRVALDTFAVAEGLSVVMSPSVAGVFSGDFKDVAPDAFLDKVATTHNLIWYYDGAALYEIGRASCRERV